MTRLLAIKTNKQTNKQTTTTSTKESVDTVIFPHHQKCVESWNISVTLDNSFFAHLKVIHKRWVDFGQFISLGNRTELTKNKYIQITTSYFKEALSVLMLCTPVFIFTSGSSACPRCGLSIRLLLLAIFNTLF